jgi:hypothetical protein
MENLIDILKADAERFGQTRVERQQLLDAANEQAKRAAFQVGEITGALTYAESLIELMGKEQRRERSAALDRVIREDNGDDDKDE